jgi:ubiquinone/menaquinone biosynthesis C-methylase UbiE
MPLSRVLMFALCALPLLASSVVRADDAAYQSQPGTPDGIGKFYYGREIAQVMGFDGAPWLDRASRDSEERPDLLIQELHLRRGMMVADVGAGSGYLSRRMAPLVAPGRIYAVDVQPQMVDLLRKLSAEPGLQNIVPTQGKVDDVGLAPDSIDLAIMVDVYHELAFPREVMASIVQALKPGGEVVFVEYRGEDPAVPIKALHKMSKAQVMKEMHQFPVTLERTSERLPVQHIIFFVKSRQRHDRD